MHFRVCVVCVSWCRWCQPIPAARQRLQLQQARSSFLADKPAAHSGNPLTARTNIYTFNYVAYTLLLVSDRILLFFKHPPWWCKSIFLSSWFYFVEHRTQISAPRLTHFFTRHPRAMRFNASRTHPIYNRPTDGRSAVLCRRERVLFAFRIIPQITRHNHLTELNRPNRISLFVAANAQCAIYLWHLVIVLFVLRVPLPLPRLCYKQPHSTVARSRMTILNQSVFIIPYGLVVGRRKTPF